MAFKFGNLALSVDDSKDGVVFLTGEVIGDNKMRITGTYDNIYEAWNVIVSKYGQKLFLPKKLEKYL